MKICKQADAILLPSITHGGYFLDGRVDDQQIIQTPSQEDIQEDVEEDGRRVCLLYTSPSPRD